MRTAPAGAPLQPTERFQAVYNLALKISTKPTVVILKVIYYLDKPKRYFGKCKIL
jgi:hypothetical protein